MGANPGMTLDADARPPGFLGLLWRMSLAGGIVFAIAAAASYLAVENLVRTEEVEAPDVLTLPLEDAVRRTSAMGFPLRIGASEPTLILSPGRVISQRPGPGKRMKRGGTILVTLSESPGGALLASAPAVGG